MLASGNKCYKCYKPRNFQQIIFSKNFFFCLEVNFSSMCVKRIFFKNCGKCQLSAKQVHCYSFHKALYFPTKQSVFLKLYFQVHFYLSSACVKRILLKKCGKCSAILPTKPCISLTKHQPAEHALPLLVDGYPLKRGKSPFSLRPPLHFLVFHHSESFVCLFVTIQLMRQMFKHTAVYNTLTTCSRRKTGN